MGARGIECGKGAIAGPEEAVILVACKIISRDRPRRVDGVREGALVGAREIERGEGTVADPPEAVRRAVVCALLIGSHYRPRRVDAVGLGVYGARRGIEAGEGTIGGPQEAVKQEACVFVYTRDRSRLVNSLGVGLGA